MESPAVCLGEHAIGAFLDSCYKGDQAAIVTQLEKGVDVNGSDAVYTTPLQVAAASGHEGIVQLLVGRGARPDATNLYGWTPLMHAARHGHAGVVALLLQRGADATRTNRLGELGGWSGEARGADPNARNTRGETALDMARVTAQRQVCRILDEHTAEPDDATDCGLHEAVRRHDVRLAAQLLAPGGDLVNQLTPEGGSPLMLAALDGDAEMAALLLRHGAAVNQQDPSTGWTALMQAVFHDHAAIVKILLTAGADANLRAHNGCTAFDLASLVDSKPDMIRLLAACTYKYTPPMPAAGLQGAPSVPLAWQTRAVSTPSLQDRGLKAFWNRMSHRFRNVKPRVEPVQVLGVRSIPEEVSEKGSTAAPKLTLDGVLPASKRVKGGMPQGFPSRSLSSDMLRPVLPPFYCDRAMRDRCCLPPALKDGPLPPPPSEGTSMAPQGGHLNTFRLLRYLRSPNSSPSSSLNQRRMLSPGPHSSGDSGFETLGKSSDHPCFNKAKVSPSKRFSNKAKQKPPKSLERHQQTSAAALVSKLLTWGTVSKLTYLLRSLGMARYGPVFAAQEIDFEAFVALSEADLNELEIGRKDREKFALVISELRSKLPV
ncbi:ankyrin repeat and SAM domain-containing protein 6-like [Pollicipes pollicipes]|uniref:ankyrin repeat and SAM domain-containing protein 6-like n=1 Tax=Pollicipes pollicipes TaxID=41117 RepID=UPI00188540D6|nr:ankyrin repeat and SAM domain-containing protein 6-like [Pollicipes pollicipes]